MIDLQSVAQTAAAGASIVLMGICGIRLLLRFVRVLRGQESADGLERGGCGAPGRELLAVFGIALASRLALFLLAYGMHRVFGAGEDGFFVSFKPLWVHWDTRHYLGIAQDGYVATGDERLRLVFFPLYPLLMRLLSPITGGDVFYSGTLISVVCGSAAAALVYDLAHMHFGRKTAALAAAYFLLSPLSVFLCCVYTEGLFILLTLAAVPAILVCANLLYGDIVSTEVMPQSLTRFLTDVLISWLVLALTILLGIAYPAWQAVTLRPADALHEEG